MGSFATEFPIKDIRTRSVFVAQVVAWLRGNPHSQVLDYPGDADLERDTAHLRSPKGEELRLREFSQDGVSAVGFRHDFPDELGRVWRTEAVVRRAILPGSDDLIRIRTECVAKRSDAKLEIPKKPYLIKAMLGDQWGASDGGLIVTDKPFRLSDDEAGLRLAFDIIRGSATKYLPVVYVSAVGNPGWILVVDQLRKLAFDLGGVAHVVVEPSRDFSLRLRDVAVGDNPYGGTIALSLPLRGVARRFYVGLRYSEPTELLSAIRQTARDVRTQMPAGGWDWTELQEQALRQQRLRERNRLRAEDVEELYQQENDNLRDRIAQLEATISSVESTLVDDEDGFLSRSFIEKIGEEIYPGEFYDKIRLAARQAANSADKSGLDSRSLGVLSAISSLPVSPACQELKRDIVRATKDPKGMRYELSSLLRRHGYQEKSEKKHVRLQPRDGFFGLESITIAKTPGDNRGLLNMRKQIERVLGIGGD